MLSFLLEPDGLTALLFTLVLALILVFTLTNCDRTTLDRIPNAHWSCSISSTWILWQRYKGNELGTLEVLHQKLGPILRVAPADLSISSYEHGVRPIYNGSFEKPEYFDFYRYYGRKTSFSSLTRNDHSLRRRRVSAALTKSALFSSESLRAITNEIILQRLLPVLETHKSIPINILPVSYAFSLDILTTVLFGMQSGSKYLFDLPSVGAWLENYESMYCKQAFWPQELPRWTKILKILGLDMLPRSYYESRQALENWLLEIADRAELEMRSKSSDEQLQEPKTIYQILKAAVQVDSPEIGNEEQRLEIASELFDQLSGAREVFGLVLAYTIFYISQNPDAQEKLRAEVSGLMPQSGEDWAQNDEKKFDEGIKTAKMPSPTSLDRLPYLSAVLKESFRMRPNSTPLPRITPRDRTVSLAGYEIPPRTRVNVFQWFIHRNPEIFDLANEWHPERWLDDKRALSVDSAQPLWAFGSGSRMCVGASLSQYLMKYTLAAIYSRFSSKVISKKLDITEPGSLEDEIVVVFESL
ncbi:hypothetical protein CBER1_06126 [Cercospora berteroae]|uniref:Cytochrome P450 n=1 Tax=Cercospora berteroae TaxID=357750 RepID=A0A2S6C3N5_9PEZI|nr:hypothetical protein CBER1_06126 [Cercospora berteroae]